MKEVPILAELDATGEITGSMILFCSDECKDVYIEMCPGDEFAVDTEDASTLYQVFCALCGRLITATEQEDRHASLAE